MLTPSRSAPSIQHMNLVDMVQNQVLSGISVVHFEDDANIISTTERAIKKFGGAYTSIPDYHRVIPTLATVYPQPIVMLDNCDALGVPRAATIARQLYAAQFPSNRILFASGCDDLLDQLDHHIYTKAHYLPKPIDIGELAIVLHHIQHGQ